MDQRHLAVLSTARYFGFLALLIGGVLAFAQRCLQPLAGAYFARLGYVCMLMAGLLALAATASILSLLR